METTQQTTSSRDDILNALLIHISRRTGMDIRNYASSWADRDGVATFRSEYREVLRNGRDAKAFLNAIRWRSESIPVEILLTNATNGGRLTYNNGSFNYCVGQYWPTEYRSAACRYLRDCYVQGLRTCGYDYDAIKQLAKKELGSGIFNRWFY